MKKENCCSDSSTKIEYTLANETACCDSSSTTGSTCCNTSAKDENVSSCCGGEEQTSKTNSCGCSSSSTKTVVVNKEVDYHITIDGKTVHVTDASKNLVEIAKAVGIGIPAPCFLSKKKKGCCMGCVVEANGAQSYACNTRPSEGMNVTVNREDLKKIRKERLLRYQSAIKSGDLLGCEADRHD